MIKMKTNDENDMEKIDEFDIEQAEKLLENIRFMADLRSFPVQKPNSITMEMTTMQEWTKWYAKTTEWNGRDGTENEVMKMIYNLDSDMRIMVKRVEEGFRVLLRVLDKKDLRLELIKNRLEMAEDLIKSFKETKNGSPPPAPNDEPPEQQSQTTSPPETTSQTTQQTEDIPQIKKVIKVGLFNKK